MTEHILLEYNDQHNEVGVSRKDAVYRFTLIAISMNLKLSEKKFGR